MGEFCRMVENRNNMVILALQTAMKAHGGQVDKAGRDYIEHPIAVAARVNSPEEKMAAYLHDVVEDTDVTLEDLRSMGFPECVIEAVDCLTKREGVSLADYLYRVKRNEIARVVKLADLDHNSDISRIPEPKEKDYRRVERYHRESAYLMSETAEHFEE